MKFNLGDVVANYSCPHDYLFRIRCFFDRGDFNACHEHKSTAPIDGADDVHLEVIWKEPDSPLSWDVGDDITISFGNLIAPPNEMLVIAIEANGGYA